MNNSIPITLFLAVVALYPSYAEDGKKGTESNKSWDISTWSHAPDIKDKKGDTWTPMKGHHGPLQNSSAYDRSYKASILYLKEFDVFVSQLADSELIEALAKVPGIHEKTPRTFNRAEYWIALNGNKIILNEINSRHEKRPLVFSFGDKYDKGLVYTGPSGRPFRLGEFIEQLQQSPNKTHAVTNN